MPDLKRQAIVDSWPRRIDDSLARKDWGLAPAYDLRRTFAGDLLDAGADIATVQKLMGHANVSTTAGYDRRGERAKHHAIGKLHMAWNRRFIDF